MGAPYFKSRPDIIIVQLNEVFQTVRVIVKYFRVDVVVQEEFQRRRGKQFHSLRSQFLGT